MKKALLIAMLLAVGNASAQVVTFISTSSTYLPEHRYLTNVVVVKFCIDGTVWMKISTTGAVWGGQQLDIAGKPVPCPNKIKKEEKK